MCAYHCNMQESYNNYEEPIEAMRKLSEMNTPFKFSHKRLDGSTVIVLQGTLRPMAKSDKHKNAKYMLQYTNISTDTFGSCYIPSLLSFNGVKIDLSK